MFMMLSSFPRRIIFWQVPRIGNSVVRLYSPDLCDYGWWEIVEDIGHQSKKFFQVCLEFFLTWLLGPAVIVLYDNPTSRVITGLANGTISDFTLASDLNCINHNRDILAHVDRITGLMWVKELKLIISTSKDQMCTWFNDETGQQIASFNVEAAGTCLQWVFSPFLSLSLSFFNSNLIFFPRFDVATKCLFVGDANGGITLLSFAKSRDCTSYELIRQLHGHTKSVTSMCWDGITSRLISSSSDNSVILWDIGGGKGTAYELQASVNFQSVSFCHSYDLWTVTFVILFDV